MKNRITTPVGTKIILDNIGRYSLRYEDEDDDIPYAILFNFTDGSNHTLEFVHDEDEDGNHIIDVDGLYAFLARLDNYFQEIP